ncbi:MAG: hypothetical protein N2559_08780 [Anaerolineae bacterium]|nr:hypothetical protein [Anaerolineae bacterium]
MRPSRWQPNLLQPKGLTFERVVAKIYRTMAGENLHARQAWLLLLGLLGLSVLLSCTLIGLVYLLLTPPEELASDSLLEDATPTETLWHTETPTPTDTPSPSVTFTLTPLPTPSPTRRGVLEPTKPPYVFPTPIHIPPIPRPAPTRMR